MEILFANLQPKLALRKAKGKMPIDVSQRLYSSLTEDSTSKLHLSQITTRSHLPPLRRTYGKSDPLSFAHSQVLGFVQIPLHEHPIAFGGRFTLSETSLDLIYVNPIKIETYIAIQI